jgi:hypothetical protein
MTELDGLGSRFGAVGAKGVPIGAKADLVNLGFMIGRGLKGD